MNENNIKNTAAEKHTCCICGSEFIGYANNPDPIKHSGVCCDECNQLVIKERIEQAMKTWD